MAAKNVIAKAAFELQSWRVFEKRSKRGKGLRKRSRPYLGKLVCI